MCLLSIKNCSRRVWLLVIILSHYSDVIMSAMASQITGVTIVYSTVCSGAVQRKHQSPASLAFVLGIHRWPVNSQHKGPVTRKMFPFDDVIMYTYGWTYTWCSGPMDVWMQHFFNDVTPSKTITFCRLGILGPRKKMTTILQMILDNSYIAGEEDSWLHSGGT